MKNISFALTTEQVKAQQKTVTRRLGWRFLKVGQVLRPVDKVMGFKKGEKPVQIAPPIQVTAVYREPLNAITAADVTREGFPDWTPQDFINFVCKKFKCKPDTEITRIEFCYSAPSADGWMNQNLTLSDGDGQTLEDFGKLLGE